MNNKHIFQTYSEVDAELWVEYYQGEGDMRTIDEIQDLLKHRNQTIEKMYIHLKLITWISVILLLHLVAFWTMVFIHLLWVFII